MHHNDITEAQFAGLYPIQINKLWSLSNITGAQKSLQLRIEIASKDSTPTMSFVVLSGTGERSFKTIKDAVDWYNLMPPHDNFDLGKPN